MYVSNKRVSHFIKQKLIRLKGGQGKSTIMFKYINTPLSVINKTSQEIYKDIEDLSNTINYFCLVDICRTLHPIMAEYMFFSSVNRVFIETDTRP